VALPSKGGSAIASTEYSAGYAASGVIDGEHDGNNYASGGVWADGTPGVFPDNVQVSFIAGQTINEIDVYTLKDDFNSGSTVTDTTTFNSYGITNFNVQYWTGAAWVDVPGGAVTGNNLVKRKFQFPNITTDKIRVLVNDSADHYFSRVVEIEAFSCNPVPFTCANPGGTGGCFSTIQAAVNANSNGGLVVVYPGTYDEDVNIPHSNFVLRGSGANVTNIRGPIGGSTSTVVVAGNNVTVAGFTITRLGNNTTDWNNPGLNTGGISVQGPVTGMLVRDNTLTGNRTGIDVNNSSGHTIRNNVIDFNRTGIIFRNQTDYMTVVENFITNNWTAGVLFLDGSGGTNTPINSAAHSAFSNNNMSGNWYGQIVDRQSGGSLPAPNTTNLKNFRGNWFGTTSPVVTTANSAEPGYSAQIPVAYGGSATPPGGQPDVAGPASDNFRIQPILQSGTDTNVESTPGWGTFGFQGNQVSLVSPANAGGWQFFDDFGSGTGTGGFEVGKGTPPLGTGSAFLQVDSVARHAFEDFGVYHGTRMDDITSLRYSSYQNGNANTIVTASLQFDIDYDLTDANNAFQGRLVFEPYQTPTNTVQQLVWQDWDALAGRWWASNVIGQGACPQSNPCTWAQVLAAFPNAGIRNTTTSGVIFKAGGPVGSNFDGNVDAFKIGIRGFHTTYDFEPVP
jgi:parallel beta-helix repeat protein